MSKVFDFNSCKKNIRINNLKKAYDNLNISKFLIHEDKKYFVIRCMIISDKVFFICRTDLNDTFNDVLLVSCYSNKALNNLHYATEIEYNEYRTILLKGVELNE